MPRIDYDAIAHLYDEPWRDHVPDALLAEFLTTWKESAVVRVLDIGCGTGKQLAANSTAHPRLLYAGVDRSISMLRIAQLRAPDVRWVHGDGTALPFAADSFHYMSCQFAHAHISDKRTLMREAYRVAAPGGRFVQVNINPWQMDWPLYRYFPAARARDYEDFVPPEMLADYLREAGFTSVETRTSVRSEPTTIAAFQRFASARTRVSELSAISDTEYQDGLQRIAEAIRDHGDARPEPHTSYLITYIAVKPSGADPTSGQVRV